MGGTSVILDKSTLAVPQVAIGEMLADRIFEDCIFAADLILPKASSDKRQGNFPRLKRGRILMLPTVERSPGEIYPRTSFEIGGSSYECKDFGHEVILPKETNDEYPIASIESCGSIALFQLKMVREKRVASSVFNTNLFTGSSLYTDVSVTWATSASATPIDNIEAAKAKVRQNSGMIPNSVIMSYQNLLYCKACAQLVSDNIILKYPAAGMPADSDEFKAYLAMRFGVKQIIVPTVVYNSDNNPTTPTLADIWSSSYVLVAKLALPSSENDLAAEGLGRTIVWKQNDLNENYETYWSTERDSHIIRARQYLAEFLLDEQYGHLLKVD